MSVCVNYIGQTGNNLFQYLTGRIFAYSNKLTLLTLPNNGMNQLIVFNPHDDNGKYNSNLPIVTYTDDDLDDNTLEFKYRKGHNYVLNGFFQNANFFMKHRKLVESFITYLNYPDNPPLYNIKDNDVLVYIRLGDFARTSPDLCEILHPKYYTDILDANEYDTVYIILHPLNDKNAKEYISHFKKYKYVLLPENTIQNDFYLNLQFDNVICNNSTFYWWSSFFSYSKCIYIPRYIGYIGKNKTYHSKHTKTLHQLENTIPIFNDFARYTC